MRYDVSVGATGIMRLVDVVIGPFTIDGIDAEDAPILRDMLTDALDHIDECDRAAGALQISLNRRAE